VNYQVVAQPDKSDRVTGKRRGGPGRSRSERNLLWQVASILTGLVLWQVVAATALKHSLFIVPVSDVIHTEIHWFASGFIWYHLYVSASEFLIGFSLAGVAGIIIGAIMGMSRIGSLVLSPWVALLYSTPLVAITPLYILLFGIDITSKAALVFTICVFTVIVNTAAGFTTAEAKYVELAHAYGASSFQMVRKIMFPSSVPFILTGLRLASGRGIIGVVVGEFFISRAGIGFLINQAAQTFQISSLYAGVVLLAAFGLASFRFFEWLERRLAPWRET
jgi:ABC-type nitrate/sulfonate/bicarbonate transport system permease component